MYMADKLPDPKHQSSEELESSQHTHQKYSITPVRKDSSPQIIYFWGGGALKSPSRINGAYNEITDYNTDAAGRKIDVTKSKWDTK